MVRRSKDYSDSLTESCSSDDTAVHLNNTKPVSLQTTLATRSFSSMIGLRQSRQRDLASTNRGASQRDLRTLLCFASSFKSSCRYVFTSLQLSRRSARRHAGILTHYLLMDVRRHQASKLTRSEAHRDVRVGLARSSKSSKLPQVA